MTAWTAIQYRGFSDVPRIFLARHLGRLYLFDSAFDERLDDYPDEFAVFELPFGSDAELPKDWTTLAGLAVASLGTVAVADVTFDATRRQAIDASILDRFRRAVPATAATVSATAPAPAVVS